MEKSINFEFCDYIKEVLDLKEVDTLSYSPLVLAYIGDCVYDLIIKSMIVNKGNRQVHKLHEETSYFVQASTQSLMMRSMQPLLTVEEHAVYRRAVSYTHLDVYKRQN